MALAVPDASVQEIIENIKEVLANCKVKDLQQYDTALITKIWSSVEYRLHALASDFFVKNPAMDRAPYAVYAVHDTAKQEVVLDVRVGRADVERGKVGAYAQMVTGEIVRQIVRRNG